MRAFTIAQFDYIRTLVERDLARQANIIGYSGEPTSSDVYKTSLVFIRIATEILDVLKTENAKRLIELQRHYENQAIEDEIEDPEPHGSRDTFVPHPCDEYYVVRHNAAEDDERFNAMQD